MLCAWYSERRTVGEKAARFVIERGGSKPISHNWWRQGRALLISQKGQRHVLSWDYNSVFSTDPDPLSGSVVRQWDKTHSRYGSTQTSTSPSDSVSCLTRKAHVDSYQTQQALQCWRQKSLSVVRLCPVVDRGLYGCWRCVMPRVHAKSGAGHSKALTTSRKDRHAVSA